MKDEKYHCILIDRVNRVWVRNDRAVVDSSGTLFRDLRLARRGKRMVCVGRILGWRVGVAYALARHDVDD